MSLLSTLAKVAVGVAVAKGVSGMAAGQKSARTGGGAGTGSIFGDALSRGGSGGAANPSSGGGILGQILAGRGTSSGGLGGLLEGLSQASRPAGGGAGGDIQAAAPGGGSLGDLLNQSLDNFGEPETAPSASQEEAAKVMLRAMLQAAKSDGRIDGAEKEKLLGQVGDISREEMAFINEVLEQPVDIDALVRDTPRGLEAQVYTMSVMAIDLDKKTEAQYLLHLARALDIDARQANEIHTRLGEPTLYS